MGRACFLREYSAWMAFWRSSAYPETSCIAAMDLFNASEMLSALPSMKDFASVSPFSTETPLPMPTTAFFL